MNLKKLLTCPLLGIVILTSGCASIMSGPNQTVSLRTNPEGVKATFFNKKGEAVSVQQTPCIVLLKRRETYTLKLEKDEYQPLEAKLNKGLNGWYFGNLLIGGLLGTMIIDPATGAMWSFQDPVNAQLALVGSTEHSTMIKPKRSVGSGPWRRKFFSVNSLGIKQRAGIGIPC